MKQKKAGRGSLAPVRPRRDYKDTLFRMLFNEREALLSLYNAVGNTDYRDPSLLQIVTLDNAVYMNVKNDLAFLLGFELNLYEHQSTWNPNMPLRDLFYAAREYEMLIRDQSLQGIYALVQTCWELGASGETVLSALIRRFSISGEKAKSISLNIFRHSPSVLSPSYVKSFPSMILEIPAGKQIQDFRACPPDFRARPNRR